MKDLAMRSRQIRIAERSPRDGTGFEAHEQLFFFADPLTAQNAYATMVQDLAGCQALEMAYPNPVTRNPHVEVVRTGTIESGSAWSKLVTSRVYPDEAAEEHSLTVQRGRVVAVVGLDYHQGVRPQYDTSADPAILGLMAAELCVYGGQC
jgi:hypothetical protein